MEKRKTIAIVTDSGSALSQEEAKEKGIFLLPLQVIDGEHAYQDGVDISTDELYDALRQQHTPKTSMPMGSVIEETLEKIRLQGYEEILCIPLSSGLSSTFDTIQLMAADMGLNVVHIENYTTCDLQGYEALLAKAYVDEGKSAEEIQKLLHEKIMTSGTLILPNDIQHLKRGGRLTPLAAAAANLLKIKPILIIDPSTKGKIDVFDKVRTEKKAVAMAVDTISKKLEGKAGHVFVIHSDCVEKAEHIRSMLQERNDRLCIHIHTIGAVIAAHTGLDCIAIQYIEA